MGMIILASAPGGNWISALLPLLAIVAVIAISLVVLKYINKRNTEKNG